MGASANLVHRWHMGFEARALVILTGNVAGIWPRDGL